MDPIDRGADGVPTKWKHAVAHTPYPRPPVEAWRGKGFPSEIIDVMANGVVIEPFEVTVPEPDRLDAPTDASRGQSGPGGAEPVEQE